MKTKAHVLRGLILKDWYSMRTYLLRQLGLLAVVYLIIGMTMKTMSMLPAMMIMGTMMGGLTAFSLDDSCQWNGYACTMNISASHLAKARYLMFYGSLLVVTVVTSLLSGALDALLFAETEDRLQNLIIGMCGGGAVFLIYTLILAIDIPMFYKLGVEKARIPMTLTFVLPFVIIFPTASSWGPMLEEVDLSAIPWGLVGVLLLAFLVVGIFVSYRVSVRILEKKEF